MSAEFKPQDGPKSFFCTQDDGHDRPETTVGQGTYDEDKGTVHIQGKCPGCPRNDEEGARSARAINMGAANYEDGDIAVDPYSCRPNSS